MAHTHSILEYPEIDESLTTLAFTQQLNNKKQDVPICDAKCSLI